MVPPSRLSVTADFVHVGSERVDLGRERRSVERKAHELKVHFFSAGSQIQSRVPLSPTVYSWQQTHQRLIIAQIGARHSQRQPIGLAQAFRRHTSFQTRFISRSTRGDNAWASRKTMVAGHIQLKMF